VSILQSTEPFAAIERWRAMTKRARTNASRARLVHLDAADVILKIIEKVLRNPDDKQGRDFLYAQLLQLCTHFETAGLLLNPP
jgi:hypothetical protein